MLPFIWIVSSSSHDPFTWYPYEKGGFFAFKSNALSRLKELLTFCMEISKNISCLNIQPWKSPPPTSMELQLERFWKTNQLGSTYAYSWFMFMVTVYMLSTGNIWEYSMGIFLFQGPAVCCRRKHAIGTQNWLDALFSDCYTAHRFFPTNF